MSLYSCFHYYYLIPSHSDSGLACDFLQPIECGRKDRVLVLSLCFKNLVSFCWDPPVLFSLVSYPHQVTMPEDMEGVTCMERSQGGPTENQLPFRNRCSPAQTSWNVPQIWETPWNQKNFPAPRKICRQPNHKLKEWLFFKFLNVVMGYYTSSTCYAWG